MSLGLACRCFFTALGGGEPAVRLARALAGVKEPAEIREVIREVAVPTKDAPPPREIVREIPVEVIKEVPVEVVKEVIKEVPVEVVKEVVKEVEVPKEIIKEVIKEVPVEVVKEVIKEVPVEIVKEVVKEVPVEVIKEIIKEVPVERIVEKEVVREVPVEKIVEKEVVREVPKETIKETIREVPRETVREVVKLVPDTHGPTQLLSLLQQDGRLIDFFNEDIEGYDDAQIGAAVREIHTKCRRALNKYVTIVPVRTEKEGEVVSIGAGYDPSAIRVTGNVSDKVPMFGTLRHRGWKATRIELPTRPSGADPNVIMPAEVEIE